MKEYYEGMFGSLIHNIFLLLGQLEGNNEEAKKYGYDELDSDLERIEKRIKDIRKNAQPSLCETENNHTKTPSTNEGNPRFESMEGSGNTTLGLTEDICECGHGKEKHTSIGCVDMDDVTGDKCSCEKFSKKSKSETNHSQENGTRCPSTKDKGEVQSSGMEKPFNSVSSPDTSKSKESQIKQEIDKDYAKTKQSETEKGK